MERLDKLITAVSPYSRREAASLIRGGRVCVNGSICRQPDAKFDPLSLEIIIEGRQWPVRISHTLMLNKPAGYLSATEDERGKTVLSLIDLKDRYPALFPAGRLDKDTTGLLLLTSDGDLCHRIISPKSGVYKTYRLWAEGLLTEEDIKRVAEGLVLPDGQICLPGQLRILKPGTRSFAELRICEGKYHQVKRMMGGLGKGVLSLERIAIGSLRLDASLWPGEYRLLSSSDIDKIFSPLETESEP